MVPRKLVFLLLFNLAALPVAAKAADADANAAGAESTFTILSITPDADKGEVAIAFSHFVPNEVVLEEVKFLPPVAIRRWNIRRIQSGNTVVLQGAFRLGKKHVVLIQEGLEVAGKKYVKTLNEFDMPHKTPKLAFDGKSSVVELQSRQLIHLDVLNVDEILFRSLRIPPVLLPFVGDGARPVTADRDWGETLGELASIEEEFNAKAGDNPALTPFLGQALEERQIFYTAGEEDKVRTFSIPLQFRKDKTKGALYLVRVADNRFDSPASTPTRAFRVTDLGITYKTSGNSLLVWITSLNRAEPIPGVSILAFTKDMSFFPLGKTGADGVLLHRPKQLSGFKMTPSRNLEAVTREVALDEVTLLAAAGQDDVSFIALNDDIELAPEGIAQAKGSSERARLLKGQVFTERGIYRPGETVHFKGLVRELVRGEVTLPEERECRFEILNSRNEKVLNAPAALSEFGSASGQMKIQGYFPVGTYTLRMHYGPKGSSSADRTFQVQVFRAPRHFVEVSFGRKKAADDAIVNQTVERDYLLIDITGKYYAGGPVKHGQVRWKIYYAGTENKVEGFESYDFGYPYDRKEDLLESGESVLDEKGALRLEFPLDRQVLSGRRSIEVIGTVVDFDGRASSQSGSFQIRPDVLVGIARPSQPVKAGTPERLDVVVVDHKGKLIQKGALKAAVMREEGLYVRKRNIDGDVYWSYQRAWSRHYGTDLVFNKGQAAFDFDVAYGGRYLVAFTFTDRRGNEYTSGALFQLRGGYYSYEYESRDKPYESLTLLSDKEIFHPGDTAGLRILARRPVRTYLVTLEQDGIVEHRVVEAGGEEQLLNLPITAQHEPNVYVSVLGVAPRGEHPLYSAGFDDEAPAFQFGARNLVVREDTGEKLKVLIGGKEAKLEARPGERIDVELRIQDLAGEGVEAEVAVGVVNESVLALTGYQTPALDELSRFSFPLGVFTGELRRLLVHQTPFYWVKNDPVTGGGGLAASEKGLESRIRKDFNPVAYFNPSVRCDSQGRAVISFVLPDTMTTYRVYAVACDKGARFASSQKALLAVKHFYLEPGLPAFFTKGDRFRFPVTAFNKTGAQGTIAFTADADRAMTLSTEKPSYALGPFDTSVITVSANALESGETKVVFKGDFDGRRDAVELTLPVYSGNIIEHEQIVGTFNRETSLAVALPKAFAAAAGSEEGVSDLKASITFTAAPFVKLSQGLKYLLRYPYGCVEQTSSAMIPLAAVRTLVQRGLVPEISLEETDKFLGKGVERLIGMQTESGGFSYWSGYRDPRPWATIYAVSALTLARESGFDVPESNMHLAMMYLRNLLRQGDEEQTTLWAYAAYLLALNDSLNSSTYAQVNKGFAAMDREGRLLLLLAAKRSGMASENDVRDRTRAALQLKWDREKKRVYRARYREPAIALLAALSVLPDSPLADTMAAPLLEGIGSNGIWSSTSDTGWSLYALSKYLTTLNLPDSPVSVALTADSVPGGAGRFVFEPEGYGGTDLDPKALAKQPSLEMTSDASAPLFYKIALEFPRLDYNEKGHDAGFSVDKKITNSDGSKTIRVGDIVKVDVTLQAHDYGYSDVILDDPLPAGLVAINAALKTEEPLPWEYGASGSDYDSYYASTYWWDEGRYRFHPNFFEIRQSRVLAYRTYLWKGDFGFTYYARAVCEGEFVVPPTKAALMYAPEVQGTSSKATLVIAGREP